ncbi:MAG: hypothetical protein JEZ04_03160 [Spirochaetales bacterium]|nr:hypothetical protein [Spirochaetales bacterium]
MSKIIIGIHGLGNKPEELQLQEWWKAAILEGLEGRGRFRFLHFRLVYWASVLHPEALDLSISDEHSPLYLNEPYVRGKKNDLHKDWKDENKFIRNRLNRQMEKIFLEDDGSLNFSGLTDFILRHFVKDLDAYYKTNKNLKLKEQPRERICELLADTLIKHRRKKILLIAHSMGSIIAWDVLTRWAPHIKIDTLVTIGSPLGNPVIRSKMLSDIKHLTNVTPTLKTPENILNSWYNLSDYKDRVALNYNLGDDFLPNSRKVVPEDQLIWNNYEYNSDRNPHKSYGYLRCPEMSDIIGNFLRSRLRFCIRRPGK